MNKEKLNKLRKLRDSKGDRLKNLSFTAEDIFDEVTEKDYQTIVKKRQQEESFVVNDNGLGYEDLGFEDWGNEKYKSDEDDVGGKRKSAGKGANSKQTGGPSKPAKKSLKISDMFANARTSSKPALDSTSAGPVVDDSNLLDSLWSSAAGSSSTKSPHANMPFGLPSSSKSANRTSSLPSVKTPISARKLPSTSKGFNLFVNETFDEVQPTMKSSQSEVKKVKLEEGADQSYGFDDDFDEGDFSQFVNELDNDPPTTASQENVIQSKSIESAAFDSSIKIKSEPDAFPLESSQDAAAFFPQFTENLMEAPSSSSGLVNIYDNLLESDGSLRMFWFDAFEKDGIVFLFGKVLHKESGKYLSCCVTVNGLERKIFAQPNESSSFPEFHKEFSELAWNHGISKFKVAITQKKYAFEVPDVPPEGEYYEICYSYKSRSLPSEMKGKTFKRLFGTTVSALEHVIIQGKIMGPSWLSIKAPSQSSKNISWCKSEFEIHGISSLSVLTEEDLPTPPITVMSVNIKTFMDKTKRFNEIVAASLLTWSNVSMEGTSKHDETNCTVHTVVRQLNNMPFPFKLESLLKTEKMKVELCKNEKALLNYITAIIHRMDPDVFVGHNFMGFDLDILLHRMKSLNTDHWSRMGRLKRTIWPKLHSGTNESNFGERSIVSGRLIADTYISAKDLVKSKSYSLAQLASDHLGMKKQEVDFERIPEYFSDSKSLLYLIKSCQTDAFLSALLMFKLMVIPLTKQLTNIAGNLWSRTLNGARAERNEYLLLHEFTENGYICPDKTFSNRKVERDFDDDDFNGEAPAKKGGRRKPAYAGGLVLEPKKGFYDKFVLLLDFNSLYPSIIQEYNICFTTVERGNDRENADDDQAPPEVPEKSLKQGILPKLIANLVTRRRQVKAMMKNSSISPLEHDQLDIRQKALKLTANSMYGCLGFSHSRFYAKPLAMLITYKGREILQNTVDLAQEQCHLEVVYGDTDSIMINTGTDDLSKAKQIATVVKKAVNEKYRLLEIELDGIFQKLLLLKKKKYAAVVIEETKDGFLRTNVETKGLDLVRRDWCQISVEASTYVLDKILSGLNREELVEAIHSYLMKLGEDVKSDLVDREKFIVTKSLTKATEEYADAKTQPHVQVAIRMKSKGHSFKAGDIVPYLICIASNGTGNNSDSDSNLSLADRAYHLEEFKKPDSGLKIDYEWYLKQQIHPPVTRLCEHIDGTDAARLADCLGLDASKFHATHHAKSAWNNMDEQFPVFRTQISDIERFKNVDKLAVYCECCYKDVEFRGLIFDYDGKFASGTVCPNCNAEISLPLLMSSLVTSVREHILQFYSRVKVCEDLSCGYEGSKTYHNRCPTPGCRGTLREKYTESHLYDQLLYLVSLFDEEKVMRKYQSHSGKDIALSLIRDNGKVFEPFYKYARKRLSENGRNVVDLKKVFGFLSLSDPVSKQ